MKIFATSDLHGNHEALEKIVSFSNSRNDIDMLVFCGDISPVYQYTPLKELIKLQKKDYLSFKSFTDKILSTKVYFIKGNHDVFKEDSVDSCYLKTTLKINEKHKIIPFEMVSGSFYGSRREIPDNDLRMGLGDINIDENSIIIAHQPPYGILDRGSNGYWCGSSAVKEMIYNKKPYMYICGHIHEAYGTEMCGGTLVVNCACSTEETRGFLVDTETKSYEKILL